MVGGQTEVVTVTPRFTREAVYRVMEGGHPNMTTEEPACPGGSMIVKVRAGMNGGGLRGLPRELLPWILGWGPRVEVLDSPEVRAHRLNEAREVARPFGREVTTQSER